MDGKRDPNVDGNSSSLDGPPWHCSPTNRSGNISEIGRGRASFRISAGRGKIALSDVVPSKYQEMIPCQQEDSLSQRYPNAEEDTSPGLSTPGNRSHPAESNMSVVGSIAVSRGRGMLSRKQPALLVDGSVRSVGLGRNLNSKQLPRPNSELASNSAVEMRRNHKPLLRPNAFPPPKNKVEIKTKSDEKSDPLSKMSIDKLYNKHKTQIKYGKGKVIRILNGKYGIAMVLGKNGRLDKVLFDTFDVYINSQICAEMGKELDVVMKVGDFVNLHAIQIENLSLNVDDHEQIRYLATAVVYSNTIENLLNIKFPANVHPMTIMEINLVHQDKIVNFHQVTKVVKQEAGSLAEKNIVKSIKNNEMADKHGVLFWNKDESYPYLDYFCFHCKTEHKFYQNHKLYPNYAPKAFEKMHNLHMKRCRKPDSCLELGKIKFQQIKKSVEQKQQNQVLQGKTEFLRLSLLGSATKQGLKYCCFHCQYEGEGTGHFVSKEHTEHIQDCVTKISNCPGTEKEEYRRLSDGSGRHGENYRCFHCQYEGSGTGHFSSIEHRNHVKDCGTKILNCPENPQMSAIVQDLKKSTDLLMFPHGWNENMASSYHRYYCLHCKEPFTDKHHVGELNHSLHMSKNSCQPSCKMVLHNDEKYEDSVGQGTKLCSICNVKLGNRSAYKAHVKDTRHTDTVLNLLRKDVKMDENSKKNHSM